ncbi:MAG TPA: hypothetical protein VK034_30830 [Enhygromyxa sp.]|nr:hypothetical protein [Enhygromyxa sp.]
MASQSSWNAFSAFQVFGDHVPMGGFSLVVHIAADTEVIDRLLARRADRQEVLDPELARMMLRAGLGLVQSPATRFVYATCEETVVVLRPEAVAELGQSLEVHDHLISHWVGRMTSISGEALPVCGRVYELPDVGVVRKLIRSAVDGFEDQTPLRSARRLGAQLRGRGQPFHISMVETIEEQSHLLEEHGVDINALPSWWWRGVAARSNDVHDPGRVEIFAELPAGDELATLVE